MISVKNALASSWLLTKGGQGEAKGETKDFNGSQEAKGFEGNINFYSKKDLTEMKKRMRKCRKFGLENFTISVKNALASSWLLTKGSQGEAKGGTKDFNGSQEAKGFAGEINFYSKKILLILNNACPNVNNSVLKTS